MQAMRIIEKLNGSPGINFKVERGVGRDAP